MDLIQLRCFVAVADDLHFGQAARRLDMMPTAFGRHIRQLEEELGTPLVLRTTRNVSLTEDGALLLHEARDLIARADDIAVRFRARGRNRAITLRLGAIDTASAGLAPRLLYDFRRLHPEIAVQLTENKTIRLLPRLLSGSLDLAIVRPPEHPSRQIQFLPLFDETAVVAVPSDHPLRQRKRLSVQDIAQEPLILPNRRSRPHSHDLTIKLFEQAGLRPLIAQLAEEKQTIISLVAAGLGIAIVPRWSSRMNVAGVAYLPLDLDGAEHLHMLPLAAAWLRGSRDPARDALLALLQGNLRSYAEQA
jgi:DNA-binding transcriptional LysR family regulator